MAEAGSGRAQYPHFMTIGTRWMDNDVYGHVNNVVYYSYFDTVINSYLMDAGGLAIHDGPVIGLCAESHCKYMVAMAFPDVVEAGLRVEHLGRTSVRYGVGLFRAGQPEPSAQGWFVHVFVDRVTRRPAALEGRLRESLEALRTEVAA